MTGEIPFPDSGAAIVLSMIVKDEEKIIGRCLDAALRIAKDYVIVDTGSTDGTIKVVRESAKRNEARGLVSTDQWKNFGHNRTRAMTLTKEYAQKRNFDLSATYALLLDADMLLHLEGFDASALTAPSYLLEQRTPGLSWRNTRLCRLDHDWTCVGVTHEYWASKPNCVPQNLDSLWIEDIGDGSSHAEKFERDVKLLQQGMLDEPDNVRYVFYLAQTFFDLGRYAEAIPLYRKRIEMGGWYEEVWYSRYRLGLALLRSGEQAQGTVALLDAYDDRPGRAESLVALAVDRRTRSKNASALLFAQEAFKTPLSVDALFVEPPAYHRSPLEEVAINAYYTGDFEAGFQACETLLAERHEESFHARIRRNATFYVDKLSLLSKSAERMGAFPVSQAIRSANLKFLGLETANTTEYLPKNPTIIEYDGRTYVHVSLVNYHHDRGVIFAPKDADGIVRTRGVVLEWDPKTAIVQNENEPTWQMPDGWDPNVRIRGLEDQRWVVHRGSAWFTSTCFHATGEPQVVLGRMDSSLTHVDRLFRLRYSSAGACEKNWVPFSWGDGLFAIYNYDPVVVLEINTETGEALEVGSQVPPRAATSFRGGAPPLRFGDRLLTIVHEVAYFDDRRVYMHRFVELGPSGRMFRASRLFAFDHVGVEYATGMLLRGDKLIVTYGSEEREARWMEVSLETVTNMLGEPL